MAAQINFPAQINTCMDSFKKFMESDDFDMRNTRAEGGADEPPKSDQVHAYRKFRLKYANIAAAQRLLEMKPQITVRELVASQDEYSNALADMIEFSERYGFDQTIPLHALIGIYQRYAK